MDLYSVVANVVRGGNRLILPGLGAFLVKAGSGVFRPEDVTFSPFLRYNDGALEGELARTLSLGPAEAHASAVRFVEEVTQRLSAGERVEFPGLGWLQEAGTKQPIFIPIGAAGSASFPPSSTAESSSGGVTIGQGTKQGEGAVGQSSPPLANPVASQHFESSEQVTVGVGGVKSASAADEEGVRGAQASQSDSTARVVSGDRFADCSVPVRGESASVSSQARVRKPGAPRYVTRAKPAPAPRQTKRGGRIWVVFCTVLGLLVLVLVADWLWIGRVWPYVLDELGIEWYGIPVFPGVVLPEKPVVFDDSLDVKPEQIPAEQSPQASTTEERSGESELVQDYGKRAASTGVESSPSSPSHQEGRAGLRRLPSASVNRPFHIVLGSFREPENADRFVRQLRQSGLEPQVIAQESGMHAVVVASYDGYAGVLSGLEEVRKQYPQAWILQR